MQAYNGGTAMALLAALGVVLGATQATAAGCDVNDDGYVSADEAATCADRDYSTMVGSEEAITKERFDQAFADTEDVDEMWAEADANQDGLVSRAEWADWSAKRFRTANPQVQGMSVDDYEALEAQYHMGDDQRGQENAESGQSSGDSSRDSGSGEGSGSNGDGSGGGSGD
jgi:uncharacterized membrane protein YgcG